MPWSCSFIKEPMVLQKLVRKERSHPKVRRPSPAADKVMILKGKWAARTTEDLFIFVCFFKKDYLCVLSGRKKKIKDYLSLHCKLLKPALLHQKQLHSIKKIPKHISQLHSTPEKISFTPGFLELLKRCSTK